MKTTTAIDFKSQQMLDLLSQGATTRVVARKMGYSEGTIRVYLHNLYKRIGVRNKTEAVIWHLSRARHSEAPAPAPRAPEHAPESTCDESVGEMALREDLGAALGVMATFIGPYGRVWEAASRLKGAMQDERLVVRRVQSRLLWRAMLKGDFAYGKTLYDNGISEQLVVDSPSDAVMVVVLLLAGGYTGAAEKLIGRLGNKRKGASGVSAREATLMRALRESIETGDEAAMTALYHLATEPTTPSVLRQVAMVALYHAYLCLKDSERARGTANAIWAESESARQHLEAMGLRPLGSDMALPKPGKATVKTAAVREKVTAER